MSKEVSKKETTEVATDFSKYMTGPKLESFVSQIVIPRISIVQKMSPVFEQSKAKVGDIYNYGSDSVLVEQGKNLNFVVAYARSMKREEKLVGNEWQFQRMYLMTPKNEKDKWDFEINGEKYRSRPEFQVYMFSEAQLNNLEEAVPYLFTFKGHSMKKGGKTLYTYLLMLQAKFPMFSKIFTMNTVKEVDGQQSWYAANLEQKTANVDPKNFDKLFEWSQTLATIADTVKIAGEDEVLDSHQGQQAEQF